MPYTTEMIQIHQMADAMIDLLTYAQWARIRYAADRGGFEAGLKAMTRVSRQIAAEKTAAAQEIAFLQGRILGLTMQAAPVVETDYGVDLIARTKVTSSMIKSAGYRPTSAHVGVLEIEFNGATVYQYDDVPRVDYEDLLKAESAGRFFAAKIKPYYTARKIDL